MDNKIAVQIKSVLSNTRTQQAQKAKFNKGLNAIVQKEENFFKNGSDSSDSSSENPFTGNIGAEIAKYSEMTETIESAMTDDVGQEMNFFC